MSQSGEQGTSNEDEYELYLMTENENALEGEIDENENDGLVIDMAPGRAIENNEENNVNESETFESVKSLKKAIKKAWDEMPDDMVARVVDSWPDRLQACIDADGGYIE